MAEPLAGKTIAVPETRQLDVLLRLLETRGADTRAYPLVAILDPLDFGAVDAWLRSVCDRGLDVLVLLTGEGLRRLLARAEALNIGEAFRAQLAQMQTLTRGPKPAAALREIGMRSSLQAAEPTTAGVIQTLSAEDLAGRRIGVQLYGEDPNLPLIEFLQDRAAEVHAVAPYRYADQAQTDQVLELISALTTGDIDAITFTSSPQIRRLYQVARESEREPELAAGLARCCVVAVGPLVAEALAQRGVRVDVMPDSAFFIKPMVSALSEWFAQEAR